MPTVTSSVSVFVCNCLTDVSFMDFFIKWVSKFTSHGLLRIYRKKHTSSVALPLMIPHGNQHVSTSWRSHLVPMTTFHTIDYYNVKLTLFTTKWSVLTQKAKNKFPLRKFLHLAWWAVVFILIHFMAFISGEGELRYPDLLINSQLLCLWATSPLFKTNNGILILLN